ncbi:alpha-mannosidase [Pyricularia oryzae 70-15]|uniref:Alpha-mannosidase n=1 Tax=Pyricularia oryzae (strain 70-15 / ATCC MYA-4617 / FGSC 8958) TaxID=242507 RepID=G4N9I1_PYRO7|nr:alpha-mannosidase [Pyricularia oryzae 70-15]EHA50373.1 alpha-mannosidase [Pyricularia oryzae 70-15]KAI7912367.1 alpha-mannosidase [Pyricularia oryzae]
MCTGGHGGGHGDGASISRAYPLRADVPVGKRINHLYQKRLPNFSGPGQWEKFNLLAMLYDQKVSEPPHLSMSVWSAPGLTRPTFAEATSPSNEFRPTQIGESFGPSWSTHWFKVEITLPAEMQTAEQVELHWDCNNEGTVWTADGNPLQGLTGRKERVEWIIPDAFRDGAQHTIYIEMACNGMFGNGPGAPIFKNNPGGDSIQPPDPDKKFALATSELVSVYLDARRLLFDYSIISDAAMEFPENSWEQREALTVASQIIDTFKLGDKSSITAARKIAAGYLGPNVDSEAVYADSSRSPDVFAVGHCHIDTCWLWPWEETKRKVARSWSNQCDLMDRYPELNFACSQAQQFAWLKEMYPYVFERVKAKVASGQFHPIGGSWVEHDTNMPSGESLVRQFLYGQRFFESNFGARSTTSFLPDTFGQSPQIPQLCRQAGMDRFVTQKLCFNSVNDFPHTTFNWVSLDGSQVLCHMPPAKTYCANGTFAEIKRSVVEHRTLDKDRTSLILFGKGDGGGGPTWEQIERLRRLRGLSDTTGMLPRVHLGKTVDQFFDQLMPKAHTLPTWHGDLYFELHRGVYTTQANTKLKNRQAEFLLRDIELLATLASIESPESYKYPTKELREMWEGVLLCQFHDCLPGTAIKMCYDDSDKVYAKVFESATGLLQTIYATLGLSQEFDNSRLALNTLPWPRAELVKTKAGKDVVARGSGVLLSTEEFEESESQKAVTVKESSSGVFVLENEAFTVTVEKGCLTSLYDKRAKREVLAGKANQYAIYDDKPVYWQAWDVEVFHLETRQELPGNGTATTTIVEDGPHRVSVATDMKISDVSSINTTISLSASLPDEGYLPYVEFSAEVDWHENMKFLKVEFPVDIRHHEASYDTQYGVIRRPTHYNTSWDMAKFEVCSHKYADLSEHGYGVSILNDSKYGFSTAGNVMRLSLLRSPKAPDDTADMGKHSIRWAIMPHVGPLGPDTVRASFNFNNPLRVVGSGADSVLSKLSTQILTLTGDKNLVLDAVKRGEDDADISIGDLPARPQGQKSVIVRVFDSLGGRGVGTVRSLWNLAKVVKTNILEDDGDVVPLAEDGHGFEVDIGPFQVQTYRLVLA